MFHEGFAFRGNVPKQIATIGRSAIARLLFKGDRSSCDGRFFLKANRYKLLPRHNAPESCYQVDLFREPVEYATVFVKYAG